jgi:acid phosphatase (class A)
MYYTCAIAIVDHLKFYYNRPRPYQLSEYYGVSINRIITKTHKTPAYPSGHTMYAALIAEILSDKYPEHKKEFDKLVDLCGKARELQGVHYPSDNEAAKKIIKTIYPELKKYYIGVGHEL